MSPFTSDRERRLWILTFLAVVAIYSTLGLATVWSETLRNRGLLDSISALALLLLLAAVFIQAFKTRPSTPEVGIVVGMAFIYALVFLRMVSPIERTHLFEYTIVAMLIYEVLVERVANGRHVFKPALSAMGIAILIGVVDEGIQVFLPSRVFDPVDILFNTLAAVGAVTTIVTLRWVRRRWTDRRLSV